MRYVYLFLILVLMSSCAHNNLRLRKVDKRDNVEVAQENPREKRTTKEDKRPKVISVSEEEVASIVVEEKTEEVIASTPLEVKALDAEGADLIALEETPVTEQDVEPSKAYMLQEAIRAEKNAKSARNLMLASFISVIIPIFSPFSLIFFTIGSIYLFLSNRSNYITPKGDQIARTALIMQIVYAVLLVIVIAAVLALVFL
ncbi:MAG: hypothetical protein Crog4KO_18190 [Crocinitomicaceae bacterium]